MYYLSSSVGEVEILDRFQEMTMKMIKRQKHLSYEESLSGTAQAGVEKALRHPINA